jgi:hypothetical protein
MTDLPSAKAAIRRARIVWDLEGGTVVAPESVVGLTIHLIVILILFKR